MRIKKFGLLTITSTFSWLSQADGFFWALVQSQGLFCCVIVTRGVREIFILWCQLAYPKQTRSSMRCFNLDACFAVLLPPVGCVRWYIVHDVTVEALVWALVQSRGSPRCSLHAMYIVADQFVCVVSTPVLFSSIRRREFSWNERNLGLFRPYNKRILFFWSSLSSRDCEPLSLPGSTCL